MFLEFYGAAGGVTGSLHRLNVNNVDVLLDCGLFQGRREESNQLNREVPKWAAGAKALVLSHAHIDHSGNIPTLVHRGFKGNIYCTPSTRDLSSVMLRDSAMIQQQDTAYLNKKLRKQGSKKQLEPLYAVEDAERAVGQMISVPLHREINVAPGVSVTFFDSAHVLGSALCLLELAEGGRKVRFLFTGDLGREELPLLGDPETVPKVDYLLMESTYGDRKHANIDEIDDHLAEILRSTIDRGGKVYIPAFALERAQEILFALERLHDRGLAPRVPIYIDSPLAIQVTEIYKLHPEGLDPEVRQRILGRDDPFSPPGLHYVSDIASSRALQEKSEPCIIIAGSGMCEGGRILHHFTKGLESAKNSVIIVGFMADHTLGRRLIDGHRKVKVFGLERDVYASIHKLQGLSAHADCDDLISFAKRIAKDGHVKKVFLVHGEDGPREALSKSLEEVGIRNIVQGERGLRVDL